jgi:hypothetical protein
MLSRSEAAIKALVVEGCSSRHAVCYLGVPGGVAHARPSGFTQSECDDDFGLQSQRALSGVAKELPSVAYAPERFCRSRREVEFMAEPVSSSLLGIRSRGTTGLAEDLTLLELRQFLFAYVETYEELQVLACLGVGRELWWDPENVTRECGVDESATLFALERLAALGVLARQGTESGVQFRLHDDFLPRAGILDRLALEYRQNRLQLIEIMTHNAIGRVRASALETFAECFRIRGTKDDG